MIDEKKLKIGEWIPCSERLPEEDGIYIVDDRIFDNPWVHTAGFVKTSQCWNEVDTCKGETARFCTELFPIWKRLRPDGIWEGD